MATVPQTRSMHNVHSLVTQDLPPSPTLTNPDMILPEHLTPASPIDNVDHLVSPSSRSSGLSLRHVDSNAEVGIATAVMAPTRVQPGQISSPTFPQYEHGGPLSVIDEQDTPKSKRSRRGSQSSLPASPTLMPTISKQKRLSDRSDSGISDIVDWENFDSSKILNARLAADVAKAEYDEGEDGITSKRNSGVTIPGEDEMAILNAKAERILESARKRLTHMEDTLNRARHSVLLSPRSSPNMKINQPAGGLYRSISQREPGTHRRTKPPSPLIRTNPALHARGASDTTTGNGINRLSVVPEIRSASALGHSGQKDSLFPEVAARRPGHSPASTKSVSSPLRPLAQEGDSPSTTGTSPDVPAPRGLGINTLAAVSKPNISSIYLDSPTPGHQRSTSQTSTKSTHELRTKLSDLRIRINELRNKAELDKDRNSAHGSRTPSPFIIHQAPEQFYTSAPEYVQPGSPINQNAGQGWSPIRDSGTFEPRSKLALVTPQRQPHFNVLEVTPVGSTPATDIRTDQNTPSLAKQKNVVPIVVKEPILEEPQRDFEDDPALTYEDDPVAESEEEQVYLNEVLEESLQDVEPDVPDIPEHLIVANGDSQPHEDRYDAFDYENMFLHSAMGNYSTTLRSRSSSGSASIETQRAARTTPGSDIEEENEDNVKSEESMISESEGETIIAEAGPVEDMLFAAEQHPSPLGYQNGPLRPPAAPWMKPTRSNSVDSVSTAATFATATEGEGDQQEDENEMPQEILNWGNQNAQPRTFYQHTTPPQQAHDIIHSSPPQQSSPNVDAVWPTPPASALRSPLRTKAPSLPLSPVSPMSSKNGLGITTGYVPSQALPYTPPSPHRATQPLSHSVLGPFAYPSFAQTPPLRSNSTRIPPPSTQTPPLRSNSTRIPFSPHRPVQPTTAHTPKSHSEPPLSRPVDTEVLMDALIKLANPDYDSHGASERGEKFTEVDKDLVVDLLRATGAAIDGIRRAQKDGEHYMVKVYRRALDEGRAVLEGAAGQRI